MQLSPGALSSVTGRVLSGIETFDQIHSPKQIHRRDNSQKENAVNGNNAMKTPIRQSFLPRPTPRATPSRSADMTSLLNKLQSEQKALLEKYDANTDKLANITTTGFKDVKKSLALQHSSQKIHNRNVDGKLDKMDDLLSEFDRRTATMQVMLQQLSARKADVPSSITASTGPSSAMTSVRSTLFSNDDATPSTGNSTLSKPTLSKPTLSVVPPSTKTTNSQSIENILLGEELEKSHAVNAVLQQQLRSANVKMDQQDKRLRSMTTPGRDVMDIKPTPAKHSERTKKSINKAVVTARGGNKNRDIAPTRRSTRTRSSVQKEP